MRCACVVVRGGSAVRPLRPDGARRAPLLLRARGARTVHKRAARLPALAEGGGSGSAGGAPPEDGGNGDDGLSAKVREAKLKNVAAGRVRRRTSMRDAMNLALALRGEPKDEDKVWATRAASTSPRPAHLCPRNVERTSPAPPEHSLNLYFYLLSPCRRMLPTTSAP